MPAGIRLRPEFFVDGGTPPGAFEHKQEFSMTSKAIEGRQISFPQPTASGVKTMRRPLTFVGCFNLN